MSNIKKELYYYLAQSFIYLPEQELDKAYNMLLAEAKKSIFYQLDIIKNQYLTSEFNDPTIGAFPIEQKKEVVHKNSKKIYQYTLDDILIGEFKSIYAAAHSLGKGKSECGNISNCLHGKSRSCYGFKWSFIKK